MFFPMWLMVLFSILGFLALGTAVLSLFFEIGGRPDHLLATGTPAVDSDEFIRAIAGTANAPIMQGGHAKLLNNGDEAFPAMLRVVREAKHNVNWMVYIWEPGRASDMVFAALIERARAGIEVRLLLDALGCRNAPEEAINQLKAAGGKVAWFRPFRFGQFTRLHKRNHRRAIVIDGQFAFTGGMAVADEWLGDARGPAEWRDSMIGLTGCLASNLQSAFTQLWAEVTGEILVGDRFYPSHPSHPAAGSTSEKITRHVTIISSPSDENYLLRQPFWLSFRCARERIWITNPYFVPGPPTRAVLQQQARAGVDVRVLLPNERIDAKPIRWASQHYYGELLAAGVRIWEYQPTMLHAKLLVVDGVWSVVGSANLDVRSKELNEEVILGLADPGFGAQIEATFLHDLEQACEIRLDDWHRRGWFPRLRSRLCKTLEEQY